MPGRRPLTFADACRAVLADPAAAHSMDTTLAPVHARTVPENWGERRSQLVRRRVPTGVDRVLELGCGLGALLAPLGTHYEVVGADDRRAHLRFPTARGESVVCGRPVAPPVHSAFDAVCVLEPAVARHSAFDVCGGAYGALRPGGIVILAAPTDPEAVFDPEVETYRGSRYRLERAVDIGSDDVVSIDYRVTDRRDGNSVVTSEQRPLELTSTEGLTAALRSAGFTNVRVAGESDLPGVVVGTGVRPIDNGPPGGDRTAHSLDPAETGGWADDRSDE